MAQHGAGRGGVLIYENLPSLASLPCFPGGKDEPAASDQMWRSQRESSAMRIIPFWVTVPGLVLEGGPSLGECFILLAAAA